MKNIRWFMGFCTLSLMCGGALAQPRKSMAMDAPARVNNIEIACTGMGETKDDPRWASYPLRVEFFDSRRRWMIGGDVSVADAAGNKLVSVTCESIWLLVKVPPGNYLVEATVPGAKARMLPVRLRDEKQVRAQVIFPEIQNDVEAIPGTVRKPVVNDSADIYNRDMRSKNAAIDAKFKAQQQQYQAQLKSYEQEKKKVADAAAKATAAQAAYKKQMAEWEARVKACKAGNTRQCGK
jgi:hypothetical protein